MKIIILMYHIISSPFSTNEKSLAVSPSAFRAQMNFLHRKGYNVISLEKAVTALISGESVPRNAVVITFDDGFIDTYEIAFPILNEFEFPATIFVVSGLIGSTNKWMSSSNDKSRRLCTWSQLKEMVQKKITIGSHTRNHVNLNQVPVETAQKEIFESKEEIQTKLGVKVDFFAYPYGVVNDTNKKMVLEAGYKASLTTMSGFNYNHKETDPFMLRRIDVFGSDSLRHFKRKITFGANKCSNLVLFKYYSNQLLNRFL